MKKILTAFLPALALLTLGSCASTSQLTSTEDDGVYYSSKDHTNQNATASTASSAQSGSQAAQGTDANSGTDEATNPEYQSGSTGKSSGKASSSEYYDDDYGYAARIRRFNQPTYRSFGYGYYDFVYVDPFWYGGYSPYGWGPGYYGSYYDPFYSPYAYGGSYISINIGFGRPYYNPWRCGYGGGYGGYGYGYGGYGYGGYYDGYRNGYYNGLNSGYRGGYGSNSGTKTHYGPRRDGAREAVSSTAGQATGGRGRGRIDEGGVANPGGGISTGGFSAGGNGSSAPTVVPGRGRGRIVEGTSNGVTPQEAPIRQPMISQNNGGGGRDLTEQQIKDRERHQGQLSGASEQSNNPTLGNGTAVEQPRINTESTRGRWRVVDNGNASGTEVAPTTPQDYSQPRRGRYRDMQQPQSAGGSEPQRPARQRVFNEYSQPSQSAEQPVRQRASSEPSRSYSTPSNSGGGNNGGGNSGGGSRGRGRIE